MNTTVENLIAMVDKHLSTLREMWLEAKPEHKGKWIERINDALDERLVLMKQRDRVA